MTNAASGVAEIASFPVEVLIKSAPAYMARIAAFLIFDAVLNAPVSKITFNVFSPHISFNSPISSHIPS